MMKNIIIAFLLVFPIFSFAQTPSGTTRISAPLSKNDLGDTTYYTHKDADGYGGYMTVVRKGQRDSIPMVQRNYLMQVAVIEKDSIYILNGGLTNNYWLPLHKASALLGVSDSTVKYITPKQLSDSFKTRVTINYRIINTPSNVTINASDDIVVKGYSGDGANYVYTLPAAASVPAGKKIIIGDVNGSFTSNYGIVVTANAGDVVNGASSLPVNYSPYFQLVLISDGISGWNVDQTAVKYSGNTRDLDLGTHKVYAYEFDASGGVVSHNFSSYTNNFNLSATSIETSGDFALQNVGGDGGAPGWRYRHSDGRMLYYGPQVLQYHANTDTTKYVRLSNDGSVNNVSIWYNSIQGAPEIVNYKKDSTIFYTAKKYSYPYPFTSMTVNGTSIESGIGASSRQFSHAYMLASALQLPLVNNAVTGDQAADQFTSIAQTSVSNTAGQLFMIGVLANDVTQYGSNTDKQANFAAFHAADLCWLAIPDNYKTKAQSSSVSTTGTWVNSSYWGGAIGKQSAANGSTLTATVTGTSIYVWYTELDGNLGTATVTVDGGTPQTINCFGQNNALIQTINGGTKGEAMLRIPGLSNTVHTVVITVTSSSGTVYIDAVGGNISATTGAIPLVLQDQIANRFTQAGFSAYNPIIATNVANLVADGFNIVIAPVENTLVQPNDFASDLSHPNNIGHAKLYAVEKRIIDSITGITSSPVAYSSANIITLPGTSYNTGNGNQLVLNSGWTSTGWVGDTSAFTHTPGNINALSYTPAIITGVPYTLSFGVTGITAGSVTASIGGVTIGTYSTSSIIATSVSLTNYNPLTFTPTSDFSGTITRISLTSITNSLPPTEVFFMDTVKIFERRISRGASFGFGIGAGAHWGYSANENIAGGTGSQFNTGTGGGNVSFGLNTLWSNTNGQLQFAASPYAGYKANGIANVFIGPYAGYNNLSTDITTANNVVLIGQGTAGNSATGNGQLSIQNALFGINNTNISGGVSAGYIGLYTKIPTQKLEVAGGFIISSSRIAGQGVGFIQDYNNGVSRLLSIDYPNGLYKQLDYNALFHTWNAKGTEYIRLDSLGNFLYKTTTPIITGANFNSNMYVSGQGSFGTTTQAQSLNANAALFNGTRANSGIGLIADYNGTTSRILSYNYTGAAYLPLDLNSSFTTFSIGGSEKFKIGTGGLWSLNGTAGTALQVAQVNASGNGMQWAVVQPMAKAVAAGATGTVSQPMSNISLLTLTPTGNVTINSTGGTAGQICKIEILTSGTNSYTVIFGTNFISTGPITTGTVTGKYFTVSFHNNGTSWIQDGAVVGPM